MAIARLLGTRTAVVLASIVVIAAGAATLRVTGVWGGGVHGDTAHVDGATAGPAPSTDPAGTARISDHAAPDKPPVRICNDRSQLTGPAQPPKGATVIPAGDNAALLFSLRAPNTVFYFAPGVHTMGTDQFGQIIPGNGSSFIGAPEAILSGGNHNLYAFTGTAQDVKISYLTIKDFGTGLSNNDAGVVNHDRGANWTISHNTMSGNDGAAAMLGSGNVLTINCMTDNGQYGFSSVPQQDEDAAIGVVIDRNEISHNNTDNWEKNRAGCGCTGGGKLWSVNGARITNNYVHDNHGAGLWADNDNRGILFQGNYISNNDKHGIEYEVSYNFAIRYNTFIRNSIVEGKEFASRKDPFPSGAIYISESGGDARAGQTYTDSEIVGNQFTDNWDGIVLWENADRFCRPNEDFDTSNGCPWFDHTWGTRYRTQNIRIAENTFSIDKKTLGCSTFCGRQAVFSNWGTVPDNSPYKGDVIEKSITFSQHNTWSDNSYRGAWTFVPFSTDRSVPWSDWQAPPYRQDAGSTLS